MNKKSWLDYIYYKLGNQQYDFYLQYSEKNGINTKWKKYSESIFPIDFDGTCEDKKIQWFFENVNQRQILPNEIVLDLEEKKQLMPVIRRLEKLNWKYYVFETGSRGYHIHIFFKDKLSIKKKEKIINYFDADMMKAGSKTLISLEFSKHWKSGNIKKLIGVKNGI